MNWYLKALKQYVDFEGRARRKEYWMFVLFNTIFALAAILLDNVLGINFGRDIFYGPLYILYAAATLLPNLAVGVRRLHDIGKSGWMLLINLIPIAGPIWFLILMVTDSDPGENEFGQNPKDPQMESLELKKVNPSSIVVNERSGDILILLVVIWMLVSELYWVIFPRLYSNYGISEFQGIARFISLVWGFVPLVLAFAVKDKQKRLLLFIIGGIYFIIGIIQILSRYNY